MDTQDPIFPDQQPTAGPPWPEWQNMPRPQPYRLPGFESFSNLHEDQLLDTTPVYPGPFAQSEDVPLSFGQLAVYLDEADEFLSICTSRQGNLLNLMLCPAMPTAIRALILKRLRTRRWSCEIIPV